MEKFVKKNSRNERMKTMVQDENNWCKYKLEPECELASSSNSCILEAINLIIEDYKKCFMGRSLVLTGKSIIIITCGDGI